MTTSTRTRTPKLDAEQYARLDEIEAAGNDGAEPRPANLVDGRLAELGLIYMLRNGRWVTTSEGRETHDAIERTLPNVKPGDFVAYVMVTDTQVWEVVAVTPSTIRVRKATVTDDVMRSENRGGNSWSCKYFRVEADADAPVRTVRRRKDGTYRMGQGAAPLRPCTRIDGVPVQFTDYRY